MVGELSAVARLQLVSRAVISSVDEVKLTHVKPHEIVKTANSLFNLKSFCVTHQCAYLGKPFVKGDVQVVPNLIVLFCVEILGDKVSKNLSL